jgi:probable H4MPT-linked C1 transfer pathway protein
MVNVLGLDIGGANTKAASVTVANGAIIDFQTRLEYFPFWKRDTQQLCTMLTQLKDAVCGSVPPDCVAVTVTAELSDAYRTKRDGITHILDCVNEVFRGISVLVLDLDGDLRTVSAAKAEPLKVAAANWVATGWLVSQKLRDCVVVDVGSTTTSIIPIVGGKVSALGKTDLEKLVNGELVYTGSLRTNVAAIVQTVPVSGGEARVSSELFAQSGDVHLVLGNISEADYTAETADGKEKTCPAALARLARVVCADTDMLTEPQILKIATYVYEKQVDQITQGINQVYARLQPDAKASVSVVVTGLGKDFLARKAAQNASISSIVDFGALFGRGAALASPAAGVALMAATKLVGRQISWMQ